MKTPDSIKKFAEVFEKLPGIGPRQAVRLGFHLAQLGEGERAEIAKVVEGLSSVKICEQCFYVHERDGALCEICSDPARDKSLVAVVEKETDLTSIEGTGKYKGLYLVLGDLRRRGELEPGQKLRLKALKSRLAKLPASAGSGQAAGKAEEIIVAVNPTSVGNINAEAIVDELKDSTKKITRLGLGIPSGGEIEFADAETLGAAMERRG